MKDLLRIRVRVAWRHLAIFLGAIVLGGLAAFVAAQIYAPAQYVALAAMLVITVYWWNAFELFEIYDKDEESAD